MLVLQRTGLWASTLEARLEELDRVVVSQAEIKSIVADAIEFISGLEFTLCRGLAQEKLVALRRCIEKISINKPAGTVKLTVHSVPAKEIDCEVGWHVVEPKLLVYGFSSFGQGALSVKELRLELDKSRSGQRI